MTGPHDVFARDVIPDGILCRAFASRSMYVSRHRRNSGSGLAVKISWNGKPSYSAAGLRWDRRPFNAAQARAVVEHAQHILHSGQAISELVHRVHAERLHGLRGEALTVGPPGGRGRGKQTRQPDRRQSLPFYATLLTHTE